MIRRIAGATALALLAALPHATAPQTAQAGLPLFGFPKKSKPPVVLLAEMIDDLEESLNDTGTIVAKKPDVWGESRLTKHREQVEEQLKEQLKKFQPVLSGTSVMTDQAFLANALAIQAAIGPQGRIPTWTGTGYQFTPPNNTPVTVANFPVAQSVITTDSKPVDTTKSDGSPTIVGTAPGGFPLTSSLLGNVNTTEANLGFAEGGKLTLEPTVRVDQLKRYLDHLNELRRLNEGGDTADAPGYSLNLVRIPVSVMPGDDTRKGHGAEITVTAEMHLTRELLPTTFRSMVIQDLMDELSLPAVKLADVAVALARSRQQLAGAEKMHNDARDTLVREQEKLDATRSRTGSVKRDIASLEVLFSDLEGALQSESTRLVLASFSHKVPEISNVTGKYPNWNNSIINSLTSLIDDSDEPFTSYYKYILCIFDKDNCRKDLVGLQQKIEVLTVAGNDLQMDLKSRYDDQLVLELAEEIGSIEGLNKELNKNQQLELARSMVEQWQTGRRSFDITHHLDTRPLVTKSGSSGILGTIADLQSTANRWQRNHEFEDALMPSFGEGSGALSLEGAEGIILMAPHPQAWRQTIPLESDRASDDAGAPLLKQQADAFVYWTELDSKFQRILHHNSEIEDEGNREANEKLEGVAATIRDAMQSVKSDLLEEFTKSLDDLNRELSSARDAVQKAQEAEDALEKNVQTLSQSVQDMASALRPGSLTRRSRLPIPPTQIACVFGTNELLEIANRFQMATDNNCTEARLSEARAFLKEELEAAYDYLKTPAAQFCWERVPEIVMAVRTGNEGELARLRLDVVSGLCANTSPVPGAIDGQCSPATCGILPLMAWPILVEAALLDQRLNEDLQRVSQDPECECMVTGPQCFYLPDPPEEARMAFMDYVRCRWPIHVFALDPQTQDQNVAQASSIRRELQLAAALAFASGRVGASNTLRFVRRLELEEQAIALNRTAIAFAHGANTFGWRFRPRFQTMDIESNAVTVGRDLLWGGPNRDARMKNWRIEPGMRECVALVVMPSFVPHVRFDVRSHWFKLHNHDNIKGEMTDTMKLSSKIAEAQQLMEFCHLEAENYRPGEIERLYARVKQLSDRLPLQTMYAQVPYENTAGGFELFSSGVTDLGPELLDFYGVPGVSRDRQTTLFLVGKNFSVHNSVVIAGNRTCETELLSRDVMQVTIPAGSQTVFCSREGKVSDDPCAKCRGVGPCGAGCYEAVEIHLATPYGVSGQLFVPVYQEVPVAPSPEPAGPSPEEIKAEAVDAAKKLVHGHQAVFHPVTYAWSTPAVKATYLLDTCGRPSDLCLHVDSLAVVPSGATPFGPHQSLSFAARVEAVDSKGQVVAYQSSIAPSLVSMTNSTFPLYAASGVAGPHFAAQLATVVANEPELTLKASKLRVHGFVQIGDPTLPPVQLTNVLEIEIGARSVGGVGVVPCPTCPSGAATGAASVPIGENVGHVNLPAATSESLGVSEVFVGGESGSVTGPGFLSESTETRAPSATGPEIPTVPTTPTPGLSKVFLPPNTGAPEISEGPRFE